MSNGGRDLDLPSYGCHTIEVITPICFHRSVITHVEIDIACCCSRFSWCCVGYRLETPKICFGCPAGLKDIPYHTISPIPPQLLLYCYCYYTTTTTITPHHSTLLLLPPPQHTTPLCYYHHHHHNGTTTTTTSMLLLVPPPHLPGVSPLA
jgi:hypothetical protein